MNKRYYKQVTRTFWCTKVYYNIGEYDAYYYFPGELRKDEILVLPFFTNVERRTYSSHEYVKVKCSMDLDEFMQVSCIDELASN